MDVKLERIRTRVGLPWALVLVLALALASAVGFGVHSRVSAQEVRAQLPSPSDLSRTFIGVAKQVKPAVVSIDVEEKVKRSTMRGFDGPKIPGFPQFQFPQPQPRTQRGSGSGVIISPEGYILTNNHVAGEADKITVKLADGREFRAKRIGTDSETDLAVIKIEASDLPFAKLGNSDNLEQGEWVLALGSPFGLQQTMTAGIVSATGRDLQVGGPYTHFIQTDASINPGNSGGPLINMRGEVVGINTLIYSQTGYSVGVGFAIPSNLASPVYAQLIKSGKVIRGYLGVSVGAVTPAVARSVGYRGSDGALIADVRETSAPAARAGLQSGDVIVEFDGKPIKSPSELTQMVADTPVGKSVRVKYVRDGRVNTATMTLAERPSQDRANRDQDEGDVDDDRDRPEAAKLGMSFQSVGPSVVNRLRLKIPNGAIIQAVEPGSPAAEAGLQPGDVIHRVADTTVTNAQELSTALNRLQNEKEIALKIERRGQLTFVTLNLE
jgi:serine protease Do